VGAVTLRDPRLFPFASWPARAVDLAGAPMPALAIQRSNTILYCRRWTETLHFYREGLCLPVCHETDWLVELRLAPAAFLSVADERRARIKSAGGQGLTLSWQVPELRAARDQLRARGLDPGPIRPHAWGAMVCYLRDPEGHRIELWTPLRGSDG
jgi:catechol 2,3-dioxygenase-like lactoylglutathione lyase family enzyme